MCYVCSWIVLIVVGVVELYCSWLWWMGCCVVLNGGELLVLWVFCWFLFCWIWILVCWCVWNVVLYWIVVVLCCRCLWCFFFLIWVVCDCVWIGILCCRYGWLYWWFVDVMLVMLCNWNSSCVIVFVCLVMWFGWYLWVLFRWCCVLMCRLMWCCWLYWCGCCLDWECCM